MLFRFEDTNFIVELPQTPDFLRALRAGAFDWPFHEVDSGEPVSRVILAGERYELHSPGREPVQASAVEAVCGLLVDVADAMVEERPAELFLHCGAVEFAGRLVIFPSRSHAGKSTLVARMAAGGHTVLGDDILPLSRDDRRGIALGIAPRLRLPLPQAASPAFKSFVAANAAVSDGRYLYLDPDCGALAPRGTECEIGAIVLLDRQEDARAAFTRAGSSETLQTLVRQNFTSGTTAPHLLDRLHDLVGRLPCFKLTYSDLEDAADLLETTFARWPVTTDGLSSSQVDETVRDGRHGPAVTSDARFRRADGIEMRQVEGDLFLADEGGAAIYHLNAIGAAIWTLLAEPVCAFEAATALHIAFPDVPRAQIERDTALLFAEFEDAGFIRTG